MNIRKTLAVVAIAVAALSSTAHAQLNASADDLKAFTKFVIYTSI
jgi:hypothetical protein